MNRLAPVRLDALLVTALLGLAPQLPGQADARSGDTMLDARVTYRQRLTPGSDPALGSLVLTLPTVRPDVRIASARTGAGQTFEAISDRHGLDLVFRHHGGWRLPSQAVNRGLVFGAGPQLQSQGSLANRLADELSGRSLANRHSYALIGFAGYRGNRGWAVGPEAWVNADPTYRIRGLGLAIRDLRAGPLRIDLRLGATQRLDQGRAINGGVELRWYKP